MAADVQIRFRAEGKQARSEIDQLKKEFADLRQQMGQTQRTATQTAASVDKVGDEAQAAAIGVTSLGRNIFKTSAEAKRFNGVFLDTHGIIREANGEFAKTKETIDRLGDEARETTREVKGLGTALDTSGRGVTGFAGATQGASRGTQIFTRALGSAAGILAELGIHSAVRAIADFATGSVRAAGELEQYLRATEQITGSTFAAEERIESLIEIANLPGLNFEALTRFSNRLIAAGVSAEDTDKILLTTGQTVVSLGGSAEKAALAMEQIIQAIQLGTVDMRDFRTIVQQIPGFLEVLGDVHGVAANLDGLHDAFDKVGRNMRDLLIPTFDELAKRYESPPPDSYIVSIDRLKNSFFLFQAELGEKVLPAVSATARGLADLFDGMRNFLDRESGTEFERFAAALTAADTALAQNTAIQKRIEALEGLILAIEVAASKNANLLSVKGQETQTARELHAYREELELLQHTVDRTGKGAEALNALLRSQESELAAVRSEIERLTEVVETGHNRTTGKARAEVEKWRNEEARLNSEIDVTRKLIQATVTPLSESTEATQAATQTTHAYIRSVSELGGVLSEVDPQFLTFHERATVLQSTLRELPSEITAIHGEFDVFAPTAERVNAIFENLTVSLSDAAKEQQELTQYSRELIHELEVLDRLGRPFEVLHEDINLVNPAISDAAENMRLYIREMDDLQTEFETTDAISDRITQSVREQGIAFDALRATVKPASVEISDALDALDTEVVAVASEVDLLGDAFRAMGDTSARVLDQLVGEFSQLDGVVGALGTKIGQFDIAGLASGNPNAIATLPFQLYNAFTFDQRQADARLPALDRANRTAFERGDFGIPTDLLEFGRSQVARAVGVTDDRQLQALLQGLDPVIGKTTLDAVATLPDRILETIQGYTDQIVGALQAEVDQAEFNLDFAKSTGGDVQTAVQALIDAQTELYQTQIDSYNAQRLATGRVVGNVEELNRILNDLNNDTRLQLAPTAASDRYNLRQRILQGQHEGSTEDIARAQYGATAYDAEVAAAQAAVTEVETEATKTTEAATETLRHVHRFTQEQADILSGLRDAVEIAETAFERLTDESRPEEITAAYTALATAQQTLFQTQVGFIKTATGLTETARTQGLAKSRIDFENSIATANTQLVDALTGIGQELTTTLTDWFSILQGSALAVQAIPSPSVPETPPSPTETPRDTSLLQNRVQRAQFDLGLSESESEFEERRGVLIREINAYYDAELERIEQVANAETDLQNLREDNQLARDQALQRAKTANNTFAAERIANEKRVADEQERAAEQAARAAEKLAAEQEQEQERAARAAEKLAQEQLRAAEQAARAEAQRQREAEAQRNRELAQEGALDRNRLERARYELSLSQSESEFEKNRQNLIKVTNEFYDNELKRIEAVGGAEAERQDKREDLLLAQEKALQHLQTLDNQFTEERIANEKRVADEQERLLEQAQREQERLLEQERREAERTQEKIQDLREDSLDAQAALLDKELDLQEDHNRKIIGLETDLNRDLDDLRRERLQDARKDQLDYTRNLEDLNTEYARKLFGGDVVSFADLTEDQRRQLEADTDYQREKFDLDRDLERERRDRQDEFGRLTPGHPGYDFYRQHLESGTLTNQNLIQSLFGTQGLEDFLDFSRGTEDAEQALAQGLLDATKAYNETVAANTLAIDTLTAQANELTPAQTLAIEANTTATAALETPMSGTATALESLVTPLEENVTAITDLATPLETHRLAMEALVSPIDRLESRFEPLTTSIHALVLQVSRFATGFGIPRANPALLLPPDDAREQGGNELFHFEQTDAIARRLARQAAFRQPRPAA